MCVAFLTVLYRAASSSQSHNSIFSLSDRGCMHGQEAWLRCLSAKRDCQGRRAVKYLWSRGFDWVEHWREDLDRWGGL